jgi:hypothetical protein
VTVTVEEAIALIERRLQAWRHDERVAIDRRDEAKARACHLQVAMLQKLREDLRGDSSSC